MSLALTIRGNPLPLRRHRTSRGFVYNPSANAQASFRNQTSMLVFGMPANDADKNQPSGHENAVPSRLVPPLFPAEAFLAVTLILRLKRPLHHFRSSKRETCTLKASAPSSLTSVTRTDADNLAKFVLDACNGLLYDDDRQIQSLHVIKKLDNEEDCLGATELYIRTIDDSMQADILWHATQPYFCPNLEETT
jgi:Holliday junction resolvase RusA-like endonuclease